MKRGARTVLGVVIVAMGGFPTVSWSEAAGARPGLAIPAAIARVVDDNWNSPAAPDYILIQDIHRHPEAQAHIASILLYLHYHWGMREVLVEGAYAGSPVSLDPWTGHNLPALRTALNQGTLTGPEMAALMVPDRDLVLSGLEDPDLYVQNLKAFDAVRRHSGAAIRDLETMKLLQRTFDLSATRFSNDQLETMDRLLQLKLKPAEWSAFQHSSLESPSSAILAQTLQEARSFYEIADLRSGVFLRALEASGAEGPKVLVVGGFHTSAIAADLRKKNRSYVVIAPHVTRSGFDDLYERGMQESISALKLR